MAAKYIALPLAALLLAGCGDKKTYRTINPSTVSQSYTASAAFPTAEDMREDSLVLTDQSGKEVRLKGPKEVVKNHIRNGGLLTFTYPEGSGSVDMTDVKISPNGFYRGTVISVESSLHKDVKGRALYGELMLRLVDVNGVEIEARYTPDPETTKEYTTLLNENRGKKATVAMGLHNLRSLTIEEPLEYTKQSK